MDAPSGDHRPAFDPQAVPEHEHLFVTGSAIMVGHPQLPQGVSIVVYCARCLFPAHVEVKFDVRAGLLVPEMARSAPSTAPPGPR